MGLNVVISAAVAVLVSVMCVVCGLSLASRRWAEMRTQWNQESQAEWDRRAALLMRQVDDRLASVHRVFGQLGDKTWADLRAECVAEAGGGWRAGDEALRAWVTEALQARAAVLQQQTATSMLAALVALQPGGLAPNGVGAATEVQGAVLQQQALGELRQVLAELQTISRTKASDRLRARLGVLEGAVNEIQSAVGLLQRQERPVIGQVVTAALEARGADVRLLAERVTRLAAERALVQPETVTQLAAQLGVLQAALKQYEADWVAGQGLEQKVYERLVRRMELMVAADVRAAQAELEAYWGEMWPRPRRAQRQPLREARHAAHAG